MLNDRDWILAACTDLQLGRFQSPWRARKIGTMSSDPGIVAFIVDQAGGAGSAVTARAMFGEYALYRDDRLVALVCDDKLFVKPTIAGRAHAPDAIEASPYPGAKAHLVIDEARWDDQVWLAELFRRTAAELPLPKPRTRRTARPDPGSSA